MFSDLNHLRMRKNASIPSWWGLTRPSMPGFTTGSEYQTGVDGRVKPHHDGGGKKNNYDNAFNILKRALKALPVLLILFNPAAGWACSCSDDGELQGGDGTRATYTNIDNYTDKEFNWLSQQLGKIVAALSTQQSSSAGLKTQYEGQITNTHMQDNHTIASDNDRAKAADEFVPSAASCQNHTASSGMATAALHTISLKMNPPSNGAGASGNATGTIGANGSLSAAHQLTQNRMAATGFCDKSEDPACQAPVNTNAADPQNLTDADILPNKAIFDVLTYGPGLPAAGAAVAPQHVRSNAGLDYVSYAIESIPPDPVRTSNTTPSAQVQEETMRRTEARARLEMARSVLMEFVSERDPSPGAGNWLKDTVIGANGGPANISAYEAWQDMMSTRYTYNNGQWFQHWDSATPLEAQREFVEQLGQMMMFSWKESQLMDKMSAVQGEILATLVGIEEKKVDRHVQ